jgi:hypothetical protein
LESCCRRPPVSSSQRFCCGTAHGGAQPKEASLGKSPRVTDCHWSIPWTSHSTVSSSLPPKIKAPLESCCRRPPVSSSQRFCCGTARGGKMVLSKQTYIPHAAAGPAKRSISWQKSEGDRLSLVNSLDLCPTGGIRKIRMPLDWQAPFHKSPGSNIRRTLELLRSTYP